MSLRETLNQIGALQALNRDIRQHKSDRDSLHSTIEEQQKLIEGLRRQGEEVNERRIEGQKGVDARELKTKEAEETVAKLQIQLNVTKHQSEYDSIRQSIASHKADIEKWEDEELELLQQVDELRATKSVLTKELEAAGQELQEIERSVSEKAADYDERISELEGQKQDLQSGIDPRVLKAYRRVAAGRSGETALVEVRRRICQGCFTTITKQTENELLRDAEIVYCHSCGRILMLAEREEVPSEDAQD